MAYDNRFNTETSIRAAAELCAEIGADKLTFKDVSEKIGITSRSVQNYFGTVEELLRAAMEYILENAYKSFDATCTSEKYSEAKGIDQLAMIARHIISAAETNHKNIQAVTEIECILCRKTLLPDRYYTSYAKAVKNRIQNAIDKGVADGTIKKEIGKDVNAATVASFSIRGISRQIAFLLTENEKMYRESPEVCTENHVSQIRYAYSA